MRLTLLFLLPSIAVTAQAQKDLASCKPVLDATLKSISTPHHAYMTRTMLGKNHLGEQISVDGKNYVSENGGWRTSPMSVADVVKLEKENVDSSKVYTRHAVRDEAVSGQAATVYRMRTENVARSDGEVWVAKGSGLVVRVEQDIDTADDPTSKMHVSTKYDYANVKAPPGV